MILQVKVIPKAQSSSIVGWEGAELKIRLKAVPEKGEANTELIAFLSKQLKIPKSNMELVSGETSRHKRVKLYGITEEELLQRLRPD